MNCIMNMYESKLILGRKPSTFTLNEYQSWTRLVAKYNWGSLSFYPIFGLIGESGEFVEKLYRGNTEAVIKEAGDVLWYLARGTDDIGIKLNTVFERDCGVDLCGGVIDTYFIEITKLAELAKRVDREHLFVFISWRDQFAKIATLYEMLLSSRTLDIHAVIGTNVMKLESRLERGTLLGVGDDR